MSTILTNMDGAQVASQTAARSDFRLQVMSSKASHDIGWIGLGRMGEAMAARLVRRDTAFGMEPRGVEGRSAGPDGAEVVTDEAAMAHCATVSTMVSTTDDLKDILSVGAAC